MINLTENEETKALLKSALEHWGSQLQTLVLAEECSELSAAATRVLTKKGTITELFGEMADVYVMISQMIHSLGSENLFDLLVEEKLKKLRARLESQGAKIDLP